MIPEGYRILSKVTPAIEAKAIELLAQDYGYQEEAIIDDKELLFVVEEHSWYGANPDAPPTPHKGVTVYERISTDNSNGNEYPTENRLANPEGITGVGKTLLPLFATIGLVGAAYKLLRRKGKR